MAIGSLVLIPWIVFLAVTLPDRYVVSNWPITWVGFDVLLVALMVTTAYLGAFDIITAGPNDIVLAVCGAAFAELPLAALLIFATLRVMRLLAARLWLLAPGAHLWQLELPV